MKEFYTHVKDVEGACRAMLGAMTDIVAAIYDLRQSCALTLGEDKHEEVQLSIEPADAQSDREAEAEPVQEKPRKVAVALPEHYSSYLHKFGTGSRPPTAEDVADFVKVNKLVKCKMNNTATMFHDYCDEHDLYHINRTGLRYLLYSIGFKKNRDKAGSVVMVREG